MTMAGFGFTSGRVAGRQRLAPAPPAEPFGYGVLPASPFEYGQLAYQRPAAEYLFSFVHGLLLALVLPFTIFWIPLLAIPGMGNFTALDVILLLLWGSTLLGLRGSDCSPRRLKTACRIAIYALAPAVFGAVGSLIYDSTSELTGDALQHFKRFGFPAILPLALMIASRKQVGRLRNILVASVAVMVLIAFTPWASSLPIGRYLVEGSDRATGTLADPNDFGYTGVFGALVGATLAAGSARFRSFGRKCWATIGIAAGVTALVLSASRSAMMGSLAAMLFLLHTSKLSFWRKAGTATALCAAMLLGWQLFAPYQQRLGVMLEQQASEGNAASRLEAQYVVIRTWLHYPLGVGFSHMSAATETHTEGMQLISSVNGSDSVYCDFLLGTGIFGFASLLLCFRSCWALTRQSAGGQEIAYLRAGVLATFVFGLATVSPASNAVAPFFFALVGLAGVNRSNLPAQAVSRWQAV